MNEYFLDTVPNSQTQNKRGWHLQPMKLATLHAALHVWHNSGGTRLECQEYSHKACLCYMQLELRHTLMLIRLKYEQLQSPRYAVHCTVYNFYKHHYCETASYTLKKVDESWPVMWQSVCGYFTQSSAVALASVIKHLQAPLNLLLGKLEGLAVHTVPFVGGCGESLQAHPC